jgi:hypothetical protein
MARYVEVARTTDGEWMVLVNGFQWGDEPLDKSGASSEVFKSVAAAKRAYRERENYTGPIATEKLRRNMPRRKNPELRDVRVVGSNMVEAHHGSLHILYSYKTPVAILAPSGLYKTDKFHSRTTSGHIGKWFRVWNLDPKGALALPQEVIERYAENGVDPISQRGPQKNAPKKARKTARRSRLIKKMGFFKQHTMRVGHTAQDALSLAKAEQEADRRGWTYEYHPEQERYEDVYGEKDPGGEWVTVVLKDKWGNVLASLGFVDERDSSYLRGVRAQLAEEALSNPNVRAVKPRSKNPKRVRVRAGKRVRVLRRKRNPAIGILGNPPHDGKYLGKVTYIEYTHGHDGQMYYHEFKPAVYAQVMSDGGVRLWHPTNKLWKLFPEPK